jgi:hypothetical protein
VPTFLAASTDQRPPVQRLAGSSEVAPVVRGARTIGFALFRRGHVRRSVATVLFVAVLTVGLAVLMGALLPGVGLIATLLVLALSAGMIAGLVLAAACGRAPSKFLRRADDAARPR